MDESLGQFGNPQEREPLPLKSVALGLVKEQVTEKMKCML
jgi:hypothetical protein